MPKTEVLLFREDDQTIPLLDWLVTLSEKARLKCVSALRRLELLGHELRRPEVDYLRDSIYELRVGFQGINYRMLYFFDGQRAIVVSHGLIKERIVPPKEIDRAAQRRMRYLIDPEPHGFKSEQY